MKSSLLTTCLIGAGALAAACTSGVDRGAASRANSSTVVAVTPELRAELRRRGLDPDEEVCERVEQMGSTIPRNVCATRAAWAAKEKASKEGTADIQRKALQTPAPGAGG